MKIPAFAAVATLAALAALASCGPKTPEASADAAAAEAEVEAEAGNAAPTPPATATLVPAIIPPAEVADPTEPPSYEVAIASAAAVHNKALGRCKAQPKAVQTQCEQDANAAFAEAQAGLQTLRGDKE
jgi:hypothetical protein